MRRQRARGQWTHELDEMDALHVCGVEAHPFGNPLVKKDYSGDEAAQLEHEGVGYGLLI